MGVAPRALLPPDCSPACRPPPSRGSPTSLTARLFAGLRRRRLRRLARRLLRRVSLFRLLRPAHRHHRRLPGLRRLRQSAWARTRGARTVVWRSRHRTIRRWTCPRSPLVPRATSATWCRPLPARMFAAELANGRRAVTAIIGPLLQGGLTGSAWGSLPTSSRSTSHWACSSMCGQPSCAPGTSPSAVSGRARRRL